MSTKSNFYFSTVGLNARCSGYQVRKLVRFQVSGNTLSVMSGHNLAKMPKLGAVVLSEAQIDGIPRNDIEAFNYLAAINGRVNRDDESGE